MDRRNFLSTAAAVAALSHSGSLAAASKRLPIKKAVGIGMLPKDLSYEKRFQLAKDVGFEQIECTTIRSEDEARVIKEASEKAGLPIHSVMNSDHWKYPFSSSNPEDIKRGHECMEASLRNAHFWGGSTVLLVPAVVTPETRYEVAWERSQKEIRKLLPLAEELKVVIAVENVWNKFLVSPIEFAQYVDSFENSWLKAYFDVGNVVLFGYPQDWIRTLGKRIAKLHLKGFRFRPVRGASRYVAAFVPLREGDIDWKAVYAALRDIGYQGTATTEVTGGGRDELQLISHRVD